MNDKMKSTATALSIDSCLYGKILHIWLPEDIFSPLQVSPLDAQETAS